MFYLFCFIVSLILLLYVLGYGKNLDNNLIFLMIVLAVGNGGYLALQLSVNLSEAILANDLTYVSGAFGPLLVFFLICNICRIRIPNVVRIFLYALQVFVLVCALTVGKFDFFYKTVEIANGPQGTYLVKTYGPLHILHLVTLASYTFGGMIIAFVSMERKNIISRMNVSLLIFINILCVSIYFLERILHLSYEILPLAYNISVILMLIPLTKIHIYNVYTNEAIVHDELMKTGFIVFGKSLKYMSGNSYASELFPELSEWELEKKIPGSGGKFNTYLRKPLNEYASKNSTETMSGTYSYKDNVFKYEIEPFYAFRGRRGGYVIKIKDVTDLFDKKKNEE